MSLQKSVQYHSGDFVGQGEEGNLFKGVFMFVSISIVIRSYGTKITEEWLKCEISQCVLDLAEVGFRVSAAVTDDHPSNVNAFT